MILAKERQVVGLPGGFCCRLSPHPRSEDQGRRAARDQGLLAGRLPGLGAKHKMSPLFLWAPCEPNGDSPSPDPQKPTHPLRKLFLQKLFGQLAAVQSQALMLSRGLLVLPFGQQLSKLTQWLQVPLRQLRDGVLCIPVTTRECRAREGNRDGTCHTGARGFDGTSQIRNFQPCSSQRMEGSDISGGLTPPTQRVGWTWQVLPAPVNTGQRGEKLEGLEPEEERQDAGNGGYIHSEGGGGRARGQVQTGRRRDEQRGQGLSLAVFCLEPGSRMKGVVSGERRENFEGDTGMGEVLLGIRCQMTVNNLGELPARMHINSPLINFPLFV